MRKSKVYTTIGKITGFSPDLNQEKFPTYQQVEKYLNKATAFFDISVQDMHTYTDNEYRFKKAGIRALAKDIDNHKQARWYVDMKIELHFIKHNGVKIIESSQEVKPKKKLTKEQKQSLANKRMEKAKVDKKKSMAINMISRHRDKIIAHIAELRDSAVYALATKAKSTYQINNEFKNYYNKIKSPITNKDIMPNANTILKDIQHGNTTHNWNASSANSDTNFNQNMRASIQALAQGQSTQSINTSREPNSSAQNNEQRLTKPNSVENDEQSSSATAQQTSLTPKEKSISAIRAFVNQSRIQKEHAIKVQQEKKQQASERAKQASLKSSEQAKVANQAQATSKVAQENSSSQNSVVSKNNINNQSVSYNVKNSANNSEANAINSAKQRAQLQSERASQLALQKEQKEQHKQDKELTKVNRLVGQEPNDHEVAIQKAYNNLLHHSDMSHDDFRSAMEHIYKMENWDKFFKDNEQDAKKQIDKSLNQVFGNISVTYPLDFNRFPYMQQYFQSSSAPISTEHDRTVRSQLGLSTSSATSESSNDTSEVPSSTDNSMLNEDINSNSNDTNSNTEESTSGKSEMKHQSVHEIAQDDKKAHQKLIQEQKKLKGLQNTK